LDFIIRIYHDARSSECQIHNFLLHTSVAASEMVVVHTVHAMWL